MDCFRKCYMIESNLFIAYLYCNEPLDVQPSVHYYLEENGLPVTTRYSARDMDYGEDGFLIFRNGNVNREAYGVASPQLTDSRDLV